MKIKICGITSLADALMCAELGVDALGFNFHPASPRFIAAHAAAEIIRRLPPFVTPVGLFVNLLEPEQVADQARRAAVQVIQLHGDESPAYCRRLEGWPILKAVRIGKALPDDLADYPVCGFVLDSRDEARYGGTGKTFDWGLAIEAARKYRVILAGGLRPDNVAEAIRTIRPWGVDVCSGVESGPGKKDRSRLERFLDCARRA